VVLLARAACASPGEPGTTIAPAGNPPEAPVAAPDPAPAAELKPPVPVIGVRLEAVREGDTVSVPLANVEEAGNAEFSVALDEQRLDFLAYVLDGELFVRAAACPPCDSTAFALDGDELVCDACDTRFDGWTGTGIAGACVDYPKTAVAYRLDGDLVAMSVVDLLAAWQQTVAGPAPSETASAVEQSTLAPEEEEDSRPSCCR